jgi:hypothetical protein
MKQQVIHKFSTTFTHATPIYENNFVTSINMYSVGNKVRKESIYLENSEMLGDRQ